MRRIFTSGLSIALLIVALFVTLYWWYESRELEPAAASFSLLSALVVTLYAKNKNVEAEAITSTKNTMTNSGEIKIKGDITIGDNAK